MDRRSIVVSLLLGTLILHPQIIQSEDKPFVIITASYNNKHWCLHNLTSIFAQNYHNWRLIYIDDCSTDGTPDLVASYIYEYGMQKQVTLIRNKERMGHLYNQYHAIHSAKNNEIVVIVDGDDFLAHEDVLAYLNEVYANPNVWLTFGQFQYYPSGKMGFCKPIDQQIVAENLFRKKSVPLGHLRTFYAGLYQHIKKEDLMHNGTFFPMAADVATMFPMIEMADGKFQFIADVMLLYNTANMLNFSKDRENMQKMYASIILSKPCYSPLASYEKF